jgi:plasmid stability protein
MKSMTVRGIDEDISRILKDKAKREGTSVNSLLLRIVKEGLGMAKRKRNVIHSDLDHLTGGWSEEEYLEFQKKISDFEVVDED